MQAGLNLALTCDQTAAVEKIGTDIQNGKPGKHLLFGVTGSGKTEVFIRLANIAKDKGRQTICLVPEISLVPQFVAKVYQWFGQQVAILHSNLTDAQKFVEWQRIRAGQAKIVVGPRSALFAPVEDLGEQLLHVVSHRRHPAAT